MKVQKVVVENICPFSFEDRQISREIECKVEKILHSSFSFKDKNAILFVKDKGPFLDLKTIELASHTYKKSLRMVVRIEYV